MENNGNPVYKDQSHGKYREMLYSYGEDGSFTKNVGFHGEPDRVILQQAWDHFAERIEEARQQVLAGKVSPVVYYMEKNLLDPMNLSMMVGMAIWRVKRHFKPGVFRKLKPETLQKYASAFNIPMDELLNVR